MLDFRTINTLWASVLVETVARLGLTVAVISPGSRSTPLTLALAQHPSIQVVPILDERSAAFFALGQAKASGRATVLVCTSGTAGANYFPAVIEAYESQVPLLVLTADRPPELRDCASGQTIDQPKLFGRYVGAYHELALPEATLPQLRYLRQTLAHLWHQCHHPYPIPVHINAPFRDPLAPHAVDTPLAADSAVLAAALGDSFFAHLTPLTLSIPCSEGNSPLPPHLGQTDRGLIIVGPYTPTDPQGFCGAIATLSQRLGWPVLTDGLSPLRNYAHLTPNLIAPYDLLLRHRTWAAAMAPQQVLQIGPLPTSKVLREWLANTDPLRWVVTPSGRNLDPLHGRTMPLPLSIETLVMQLPIGDRPLYPYGKTWMEQAAIVTQRLQAAFADIPTLTEAKLSWQLPQMLPPGTPVMIANSMPVRDVEWFWPLNDRALQPYVSRGANGIDGTLSTALGIAQHHSHAVLLTGDLAFLHDSNGLLNAQHRALNLTILLINNQGGGIFEMLPVAALTPVFEPYFATPQAIDLGALAQAHGLEHQVIESWETLAQRLATPAIGIRILELRCDRRHDVALRRSLLALANPSL